MKDFSARLAAVSGAWFVVAVIGGSLGARSGIGTVVIVSGFAALLVFLGFLHRLLSWDGGGRGTAMTTTGCALVFLGVQAGELAYLAAEDGHAAVNADSARLLADLVDAAFVVSTVFFGLFVVTAATQLRVKRHLPAWLAWLGTAVGALAALAGVLGLLSVPSHNPLPYVAALGWTGIVSVLFAVRPHRPVAEPRPLVLDVHPAEASGAT